MIRTIGVFGEYKETSVGEIYDYFEHKEFIAVDTETNGKDPHSSKIISLQLGDADNQFFIDCRRTDIQAFAPLLKTKKLILQNCKFDYKMLKAVGIYLEDVYDTMLAECVLYCGYDKWGYGLGNLTERYLGITLEKETRSDFLNIGDRPFESRHIKYGCLDVAYLHQIKKAQENKARYLALEDCVDLENRAIMAFGDIEYNGMGFNSAKWLEISDQTDKEILQLTKDLDNLVLNDKILGKIYKPEYIQGNLFGEISRELSINYASPQQVSQICTELGYEMESTDEQHLKKYKSKHDFFKLLLDLRGKNKIISTYGRSFLDYIHPVTGRVHTSFWQVKDTGRVSSGSKRDGTPNVQNIPAENRFRNCFEAREGFSWVSIDYSQQELRLMASGSQEKGFLDVLNNNGDIHCYVGSMMFGQTITMQDKELRTRAKTVVLGKPYGMGPGKLADTLEITVDEANDLFGLYAEKFPKLNKWLSDQGNIAKQNRYSITMGPIGRKRFYPDMKEATDLRKTAQKGDKETWKKIFTIEGQTERNGANSVIQGAAANMTKEALIEVRKLITQEYNNTAYLVCTVHDAIDVEVRDDLAQEFAEKMSRIMVTIGNQYLKGVKMKADTTITKVWQK